MSEMQITHRRTVVLYDNSKYSNTMHRGVIDKFKFSTIPTIISSQLNTEQIQ